MDRHLPTQWLTDARRQTGPLAVSAVSVAEIGGGVRADERRGVVRLLDSMTAMTADREIAWRAGELRRHFRRSHSGIGIADYLIAATAEVRGCELATLNITHFPMFSGLIAPFGIERSVR